MTKCYVQKKDVFDINKLTVVGSPTITSDGVASGFSASNSINTGFILSDLYNKKWTIKTRTVYEYLDNVGTLGITLHNNANGLQWLVKGNLGIANRTGNIIFHAQTIDGSEGAKITIAQTETNLKDGDIVDLELSFNLTTYTLKAIINNSKTITKTWTPTTEDKNLLGTQSSNTIYINCRQGGGTRMDSSSLFDLSQFKIYVDNELIYSPTKPAYLLERRKEGFDRSKFTVVGSPSITEYGIFEKITTSTANLSDYVTMPFDNTSSYFRLEFNFYFGSGSARLIGDSTISCFQIYVSNWGMNGTIYNSIDGNVNIPAPVNSSTAIQIGNYNAFIEYKDNVYTIGYKREEETSFKTSSTTSATKGTKNLLSVLKQTDANANFKVDLKSITIFSNGKEVFTGAKEKFYAMRGGK